MSNDRTLNNNRQVEYSWTGYEGNTIGTVDFSQCGACDYGVIGSAGEEVDPEDGFKPCGKLQENIYQNLGDPRTNPLEHFILEHCSGGGGLELFRYDHSGDGSIDAGAWVICNGGSNQQCGMDITVGCMHVLANNYNSRANVSCSDCCQYDDVIDDPVTPDPDSCDGEYDDCGTCNGFQFFMQYVSPSFGIVPCDPNTVPPPYCMLYNTSDDPYVNTGFCDCDGNVPDCANVCGGDAINEGCGCDMGPASFQCWDGSFVCGELDCPEEEEPPVEEEEPPIDEDEFYCGCQPDGTNCYRPGYFNLDVDNVDGEDYADNLSYVTEVGGTRQCIIEDVKNRDCGGDDFDCAIKIRCSDESSPFTMDDVGVEVDVSLSSLALSNGAEEGFTDISGRWYICNDGSDTEDDDGEDFNLCCHPDSPTTGNQCASVCNDPPTVYGCTDPEALNYNFEANTDDGSCEYPEEVDDDSEIEYDQTLNLVTIEGTYRIDGLEITSPEDDVISLLYSGRNFQITNDTVVINNRVKYSVTFDGEELSEYAVGFNLKTTNQDGVIVILRSSEVVPVTNILGGQIRYDINFVYDESSLVEGCTDPTATNYSNTSTIDNGSCEYNIYGCNDPTACSCDTCFELCEHCGTEQEYLCVSQFGFYNQNPNAAGAECTYPPIAINVGFTDDVKNVEDFNWIPEYRPYDDEEFVYTYLTAEGDGGFNNDIVINLNGNGVTSYSFDVEGIIFRECVLSTGTQNDCQLTLNINNSTSEISVLCGSVISDDLSISCSVDDIVKLHSCIKNNLFLSGDDEQQSETSTSCVDLNINDDMDLRLIKLNKLNNKLYTHINDLHRGKNKFSTPVLAPFCCKHEWELLEPDYNITSLATCTGSVYILGQEPTEESCNGQYTYSCGAPNSGDINASGTVNVLDIVAMITYILDGDEFLETFTNDDGVLIYSGDNPLCNFVGDSGGGGGEEDLPPIDRTNTGIADITGDGSVNVLDIVQAVNIILGYAGDDSPPISIFTGECRNIEFDNCFESIGCTYDPGQGTTAVELNCQQIFDGIVGEEHGYSFGDCPNTENFEQCEFTPQGLDLDNPFIPGTDRIVQHSAELLRCGQSMPQLGIINQNSSEDFYDFDLNVLYEIYDDGLFLDYAEQCTELGGYVNPSEYSSWRGNNGPFRDGYYLAEHLGSNVGTEASGDCPSLTEGGYFIPSARYGPIQFTRETNLGLLFVRPNGCFNEISLLPNITRERHHGHSSYNYFICNGDGWNGVIGDIENPEAFPLVNEEFCQRVTPSDVYTEDDPYGWVAKACCKDNSVKNSFKIPYYGVLPFFNNYRGESQDEYYYKHSEFLHVTTQFPYSLGVVPPCKEFMYEKITTSLAFDEKLSDLWDELGLSYSIKVIEYETELISHVIITGDTLPSIWLGTLTDLNIGEGYLYSVFMPYDEFGSPSDQDGGMGFENDRFKYFRYQMQYDECGICSEGSALHILNSDKDFDNTCCLYPNNVIRYYQEDNEFNTGVGKTYLQAINLCDSNDDVVVRTIGEGEDEQTLTFHSELNSDDCPGTLDCLGVCHEGLTIEEASILTTYAQIDQYGGCCLQGNIDLCGICDGDSSACDTSGWIPQQGFFELQITDTTQIEPLTDADNLNAGMISIQVNSDTDISEIKFNVVGLNINLGYFSTDSQYTDFGVYVTPEYGKTQVVISSILSQDLFPTIPAGTFNVILAFDEIVYSAQDFIDNESRAYIDYQTIQGMKLNQSIQSNNLENLTTNPLFYYGCGDPGSANYDVVCGNLGDLCIEIPPSSPFESYCIYSFIDCNGDVNGTAYVNSCGVCVGGETEYQEDTDNVGKDCYGVCFGINFIDDCEVCSCSDIGNDLCGGNDHEPNSDKDCAGVCFGDLLVDECGQCAGGGIANQGCGCFVQGPVPHYEDFDYDGLGDENSETVDYCLVFSTIGEPTTSLAPDNYSPIFGDPDPICPVGTQYDCAGNCIINNTICPGELTPGTVDNPLPICDELMVAPLVYDDCGECGGDNSDKDECGVCFGDNASCTDCSGEINGGAFIDNCGECVEEGSDPDGNKDCSGSCENIHEILTYYYDGDGDGIGCSDDGFQWTGCSDNVPPNYVLVSDEGLEDGDLCQCNGEFDDCGVCNGDNLDKDCGGVCFGPNIYDDCGTCYDAENLDPPNVCYGCTYPDADNYGGEFTTIDDGSCEYDELIRNIYESPAIYIQGDKSLQYISFFLPEFINDNVKSSKHLVCAGTKGENQEADEFCNREGAFEGEVCGFEVTETCQELHDNFNGIPCTLIGCNEDCSSDNYYDGSGLPNCDLLGPDAFGGIFSNVCNYGGICEKYEIHRIMMNSFYEQNPDLPENEGIQPWTDGYTSGVDELKVVTYEGGSEFENLIRYGANGWDDAGGNHLHFRVGVGYFLKTNNSGWFKLTPTREIFDWEEE